MSPAARPEIDDLLQEMIAPAPSAADRGRRRRLAASAATVGLGLVGITSLTTSAVFTDNDAVSGGGFTTGTVDVALEASPETFLRIDTMVPGDVAYQPLTVRNPGSLGYRYAMEKSSEDAGAPLSEQLQLAVYAVGDTAGCTADGVAALQPLRAPAPVAADGPVLLGDRATGPQDGDRLVVSTASDVLCFALYLPLETGDEFQASSTTLGLTVWAEQSAHNG